MHLIKIGKYLAILNSKIKAVQETCLMWEVNITYYILLNQGNSLRLVHYHLMELLAFGFLRYSGPNTIPSVMSEFNSGM